MEDVQRVSAGAVFSRWFVRKCFKTRGVESSIGWARRRDSSIVNPVRGGILEAQGGPPGDLSQRRTKT